MQLRCALTTFLASGQTWAGLSGTFRTSRLHGDWSGQGESNSAIFSLEGCWTPLVLSARMILTDRPSIRRQSRVASVAYNPFRCGVTSAAFSTWWVARDLNPVCQRRWIYSPLQSPMLLATRKWYTKRDLNP